MAGSIGLDLVGMNAGRWPMDETPKSIARYRYPERGAYPDYLRASIGAVLCAVIMSGLPVNSVGFWLLAAILAALGAFVMQVRRRQLTAFALDKDNLWRASVQSTRGERFAWSDLAAMRLGYFSVRRDGRSGWMELKLRFGKVTVRVDSRLDAFPEVVRAGLGGAQANDLELDLSTLSNLESMDMGLTIAKPDLETVRTDEGRPGVSGRNGASGRNGRA
jgi:hypothetical protein